MHPFVDGEGGPKWTGIYHSFLLSTTHGKGHYSPKNHLLFIGSYSPEIAEVNLGRGFCS